MRIRRVRIERFRGIERLEFCPKACTVIIGPNNSGKSSILEAIDLLLHAGLGRPRPAPEEADYFRRDPSAGFEIEAVLGDLPEEFLADVHQYLEGWNQGSNELVPEPDGAGIEPVVRVRVRGTADFETQHEFAKPEIEGARFHPRLRQKVGWVFDGRVRDPARELFFYQGGLLDRLFANANLDTAVDALRGAVRGGAATINRDLAVNTVLTSLSNDLQEQGLIRDGELAGFEPAAVSRRALLQTLRLSLPYDEDVSVPLARQGRGAQRLVLVSVLLQLASAAGVAPIGGFEEPEEALEPLRQAQLCALFIDIVDRGGQILLVTHSPDIARSFGIEDFLLLQERAGGEGAVHLDGRVSARVRQAYERRLDGPVVRGLFCRVPVLVEGPGDRAVFEAFWRELARIDAVQRPFRLGLDVVNAEGVAQMPMLAAVLSEAGKSVVSWADQDTQQALRELERLRNEGNCAALVLHDPTLGRQNLEGALAWGCRINALAQGMHALAEDRGYEWEQQRQDLLSRCSAADADRLERARAVPSIGAFLDCLTEQEARQLVAAALASKNVSPFEMKGARQGRIIAEAVVAVQGVPDNFTRAMTELERWVVSGCAPGAVIQMVTPA
jgi:AAA ATPase-like protein/OLD-like protein